MQHSFAACRPARHQQHCQPSIRVLRHTTAKPGGCAAPDGPEHTATARRPLRCHAVLRQFPAVLPEPDQYPVRGVPHPGESSSCCACALACSKPAVPSLVRSLMACTAGIHTHRTVRPSNHNLRRPDLCGDGGCHLPGSRPAAALLKCRGGAVRDCHPDPGIQRLCCAWLHCCGGVWPGLRDLPVHPLAALPPGQQHGGSQLHPGCGLPAWVHS